MAIDEDIPSIYNYYPNQERTPTQQVMWEFWAIESERVHDQRG